MTVAELIAQLQQHPPEMRVELLYDSAVMSVDLALVSQWRPDAYSLAATEVVVCLCDVSSAVEVESAEPEDARKAV